MTAPLADLLLPEDIQRGYIYEPHPTASVLDWLLQAVQQWEAEGGEAQVGGTTVGSRARGECLGGEWAQLRISAYMHARVGGPADSG